MSVQLKKPEYTDVCTSFCSVFISVTTQTFNCTVNFNGQKMARRTVTTRI